MAATSPISLTSIPAPLSVQLREQALVEVENAKKAWIEAAHQSGKPVPSPRYRPVIYQVAH